MDDSTPKPIPSFRGSHAGGPRNRGGGGRGGGGGGGRGSRGRGRGGPPGRSGSRGRGGGGGSGGPSRGGPSSRGGGMNRPPRGIPSGLSMRPPNTRGNRDNNQNRGGYGGMNRPNAQTGGPPSKRGRWDPSGNSFGGGRRDYQAPINTGYGDYGSAPDVQSTYLMSTDYQMNSHTQGEDYTGGYKAPDARPGYRGGYTAATTYPSSYNGGGYGENNYDGRGNYESYSNSAPAINSYGKDYGPGGSRPGSDDRYGYDSYGGAPSYNQSRDNYGGSAPSYGPPRGSGAPPPRHY